jgi:DNA-nicking Smr family endonuclease
LIDNNDNDTDLWNYVTKTTKKINSNNSLKHHKNIPTKRKQRVILTPEIKSQSILKTNNKKRTVTPIHFSNENNSSGLSKKNIKEIKTGKFKVQSKLDLHGYRLKEAETLFFEFLRKSFNLKKRNILVISGKGEHGKGKIKLNIPIWIASPSLSNLIHFYSFAAPKDGGNGAYYIRLRNKEII